MKPCVIFDLDDTLIDTRGTLLPAALLRVSRALGLPVESLNARGKAIDEVLETVEGLAEVQRRAAAEAWYAPEVPPLEPLPGARAVLEALPWHLFWDRLEYRVIEHPRARVGIEVYTLSTREGSLRV